MLNCDCDDWKKHWPIIIENQMMFCVQHFAVPKYTGKTFKFCPWCGEELVSNPVKLNEKPCTICGKPCLKIGKFWIHKEFENTHAPQVSA
jgi:hypothetical protein